MKQLLLSLYDHLIRATSRQQVTCLCLLDLSAAFDTIDHTILLKRLTQWFGFTDTALSWFESYLTSRSFSVLSSGHIVNIHSSFLRRSSRVCPRAAFFIMYTTSLSTLLSGTSVDHHLYADDTQLFISFSHTISVLQSTNFSLSSPASQLGCLPTFCLSTHPKPNSWSQVYLSSLQKSTIHNLSLIIYKIFNGLVDISSNMFTPALFNINLRRHNKHLLKPIVNRNCRAFSFACRHINIWNSLPNTVVNCNSVSTFKQNLNIINFDQYLPVSFN